MSLMEVCNENPKQLPKRNRHFNISINYFQLSVLNLYLGLIVFLLSEII